MVSGKDTHIESDTANNYHAGENPRANDYQSQRSRRPAHAEHDRASANVWLAGAAQGG
jgi:hypothetical protein